MMRHMRAQNFKYVQDEARTLLAEGNFFGSAPPLGSSPETLLSKQGSAAHSDQVDDVDQFITDLPGAEVKEETDSMISRLMGVEEDTEDS